MEIDILIHRFNTREYHQLAEAGILKEDAHIELIEGRIVDMTPIGRRHSSCVKRLNNMLVPILQGRAILSVQDPVQLDDQTETEPDIAILKLREDFYSDSLPAPDDVLLIIEVADTSLEYDRKIKNPLYSRAGIRESWIINLPENLVEIYRSPSPMGYDMIMLKRSDQSLSPEALPDVTLMVDRLLE